MVRIATPPGLARYIVLKGSITVDGVSLTVSALGGAASRAARTASTGEPAPWFEVSLIPTTLEMTTLGRPSRAAGSIWRST